MFEDNPVLGLIWVLVFIFVGALFVGMIAFIVYYWRLSLRRDKAKAESLKSEAGKK